MTEGAATAAPVYLALQPARSFDVLGVRSLTQLSSIPPSVRSAFALQPPRLEAWLQSAGRFPCDLVLPRTSLDNPARFQGLTGYPDPGLLGVDRVWDLMGLTAAEKAT